MTSYFKSQEFGGWNNFKILAGGRIRWAMDVASGSTNAFKSGNIVELDSSNEVVIATGSTSAFKALVLEMHDPVGDVDTDECLASGKASLIMDDAVIESSEISSGISFAVGDYVYEDATGHLTNVDTDCDVKLGRVLSVPSGVVRFYYPGAFANLA